jgi:hypothetical protein
MHIATTHVALEKNLTKSIFPQGMADTRRRSSEFSLDAKPMGPSNYQIGLFLRQVAVKLPTGKTGFSSLRWDLPEHRRTRWTVLLVVYFRAVAVISTCPGPTSYHNRRTVFMRSNKAPSMRYTCTPSTLSPKLKPDGTWELHSVEFKKAVVTLASGSAKIDRRQCIAWSCASIFVNRLKHPLHHLEWVWAICGECFGVSSEGCIRDDRF